MRLLHLLIAVTYLVLLVLAILYFIPLFDGGSVSACERFTTRMHSDMYEYEDCITSIARDGRDPTLCRYIENVFVTDAPSVERDHCYWTLVRDSRDLSICSMMESEYNNRWCRAFVNEDWKQCNNTDCMNDVAYLTRDETICHEEGADTATCLAIVRKDDLLCADLEGSYAFDCYWKLAEIGGDIRACQKLPSEGLFMFNAPGKSDCYRATVSRFGSGICGDLADDKDGCYDAAAREQFNPDICKKIQDGGLRQACDSASRPPPSYDDTLRRIAAYLGWGKRTTAFGSLEAATQISGPD